MTRSEQHAADLAALDAHMARLRGQVNAFRGIVPQEHTEPVNEYTEPASLEVGQVVNGFVVVALRGEKVAIREIGSDPNRIMGNRNRTASHRWYRMDSPILARKLNL